MSLYINQSDDELFQLYLLGNSEAFNALFMKYHVLVARVAFGIVHSWHVAEDVSQEVFKSIHSCRYQYKIGTSFRAWISTITRSAALEAFRNNPQKIINIDGAEDVGVAGDQIKIDLVDEVKKVISDLFQSDKKIISRYFFEHRSYKQIADDEHIPVATARYRVNAALSRFKNEWMKHESRNNSTQMDSR